MNDSLINILDLPNEILLLIFTKLKNVDVLYSLIGIDDKLDRIVCDDIFTQSIDFVTTSSDDEHGSITDQIMNRFCRKILPRIHQNVTCFTCESLSLKYILQASDYPNLYRLNLFELNLEQALYYFNGTEFVSFLL
jgi:hypothetical protein